MAPQSNTRPLVVKICDSTPMDPSVPSLKPYQIQTNNTIVIDSLDPTSGSLQALNEAIKSEIRDHYQVKADISFLVAVWQGTNSGMRTHITESNVSRILELIKKNSKLYLEAHLHYQPLTPAVTKEDRDSVEPLSLSSPHSQIPHGSAQASTQGFNFEPLINQPGDLRSLDDFTAFLARNPSFGDTSGETSPSFFQNSFQNSFDFYGTNAANDSFNNQQGQGSAGNKNGNQRNFYYGC